MKQKNFDEIYEEIYSNIKQEVEEKRKTVVIKSSVVYCIGIVLCFTMFFVVRYGMQCYPNISVCFYILCFICLAFTIFYLYILDDIIERVNKDYKELFKKKVVNEIVEKNNFKYHYDEGISKHLYNNSCFEFIGYSENYYTKDLIVGELENGSTFRMAKVKTDGKKYFCGLYGIINLNFFTKANFIIKENLSSSKYNIKRIEMELSEFEKYYDVFAANNENMKKQNVLEILTPETIEQFIEFKNIFKQLIWVSICEDKIYFRISGIDIFEAPIFKSSVDFDLLKRYFLLINIPRMVYEAMIDNLLVMYGDAETREKRNLANMTIDEFARKKCKKDFCYYETEKF